MQNSNLSIRDRASVAVQGSLSREGYQGYAVENRLVAAEPHTRRGIGTE